MKRISILYSGMDSRILYHLAQRETDAAVRAVYWSHGHAQDAQERDHLPDFVERRHCDWLNTPGLDGGGLYAKATDVNGAIYIPGRNLAFAVLTACQDLCDEVWIGALANEQGPTSSDKNQLFRDTATTALSCALAPFLSSGVAIRCPLAERGWDKGSAASWAFHHGLSLGALLATWSCRCFHPPGTDKRLPCGNCDQCIRRAAIFRMLTKQDGTEATAAPLLADGIGRTWLLDLYRRAVAEGWPGRHDGPCSADCAPFMNHLAPIIDRFAPGDTALRELARLMWRELA